MHPLLKIGIRVSSKKRELKRFLYFWDSIETFSYVIQFDIRKVFATNLLNLVAIH